MNFLRKFMGVAKEEPEIALVPLGRFLLTRLPRLPKGAFECLYPDAYALIRGTSTAYYHQLCIQRVAAGADPASLVGGLNGDELDLDDDDDDLIRLNNGADDGPHTLDEWTFTIGDDLGFAVFDNDQGYRVISWKDVNGDLGDKFEFIVDPSVDASRVDDFILILFKCLYEATYQELLESIKLIDDTRLATLVSNKPTELIDDPSLILLYLQLLLLLANPIYLEQARQW